MLRGQLRKGTTTVRDSMRQAWDRAVARAMAARDEAALERLLSIALDEMLVERVMS